MAETFCTSGSVKLKSGTNVSTAITAAQYTELINQAESALNMEAKIAGVDLVANFTTYDVDARKVLEDGASSHAAVSAVAFDPSGYSKIGEAAFIANVNWTRYLEVVRKIKDKTYTDWLRSAIA